MCQRIGLLPISVMGLGGTLVSSEICACTEPAGQNYSLQVNQIRQLDTTINSLNWD
jgi:hypothetical protein